MIAIAALWLQLALAAPGVPAPPVSQAPVRGQVRGQVIDARTQAPIPGALVTLVEIARPVLTDASGRFDLGDVAAGRATLTVSVVGYIFVRRELDVGTARLDLQIPLSEGTGAYQ